MVNFNHNDNINCNQNFTQFTTNPKYNKINFYKNSTMNNNFRFIGSVSYQALRIYHQNICGLAPKTNDLLISFYPDLPHILCLTEHHLRQFQIQHIAMDKYILGVVFSRRSFLKRGGGTVCLYKNTFHFW
jgi:hypothetical protein